MSLDPHMEDSILKPQHKKKYIGLIAAAIVVVILGGMALYIRNAGVSADTITPPSPAQPTSVTPPSPDMPTSDTPPTPEDPTKPGQFIFPAGWSMVSAKAFAGYTLTKLEDAGIFLYSYNDPDYPTTSWTTFPGTVSGKKISLNPRVPLGYYAYNPTTNSIPVTLDKQTAKQITEANKTASSSYGRGWHLVYWNGAALTKDQLFSKIKITYADKSILSGTQAIAADKHTASLKVYVVVDQNSMTSSKSIKELTGTDSATTLSKMPKNSYYWIYLRRTGQRASSVAYSTATTTPANGTPCDPNDHNKIMENGQCVPPVPSLPSTLDESRNNGTAQFKVGNEFFVSLNNPGDSGYSFNEPIYDSTIFLLESHVHINQTSGRTGDFGHDEWIFKTLKAVTPTSNNLVIKSTRGAEVFTNFQIKITVTP